MKFSARDNLDEDISTLSDTVSIDLKKSPSANTLQNSYSLLLRPDRRSLKYEIEIDHPYLNTCFLRGEYSEQSVNFYEQLKLVESS